MTEQLTSHPQLAEMGFAYPMLIEGDINTLTPAAEQLADLLERASEVVTVVSEAATSDTEFDTAIVSFMNEAVESGKEDMAVGAGVLSISEPGEQPKVAEMVVGDLPSGTVIDMLRYVNDEEATREILAVVESQLNGPSAGSDTTLELPVARHNFDEKPKSTLDKEGHLDRLVAHTKYEIPQLTDEVLGGVKELDDCGLWMYEKVDIIGVFAGVKPAALIIVEGESEDFLDDVVSRMGLHFKVFKNSVAGVSRHAEIVDAIGDAWARSIANGSVRNSEAAVQYEVGKLLGYPSTSTAHFLHRLKVERETGVLPEFVLPAVSGDERLFHQFVLSPESYQAEIDQYAKPLSEAVRLMAPYTYQAILERDALATKEATLFKGLQKIGKYILEKIKREATSA